MLNDTIGQITSDTLLRLSALIQNRNNAKVPHDAPIHPPQAFVDFSLQFLLIGGYENNFSELGIESITPEISGYIAILLQSFNDSAGPFVYDFSGNGLDAVSVNGLLAGFAANHGSATATINLSGGTNAAPTGQGLTDKQTLIDNGWTITTN